MYYICLLYTSFISQYLQYATAVYETEHAYFIHKQQMEKYLPLALKMCIRDRYIFLTQPHTAGNVLCCINHSISMHDFQMNRCV